MPRALRVLQDLKAAGFSDGESFAVANAIGAARSAHDSVCDKEQLANALFDAGFSSDALSEGMAEVLSFCFWSSRFGPAYNDAGLKTRLVRAGLSNLRATALLAAIDDCVVSPRGREVRAPIRLALTPGQVVMCDFTYLRKPEMQKIRRAIVVSARSANGHGRCAVIPVSMLAANPPSPHHCGFTPGAYAFFHPANPVWAICDHVYTVALSRLWQINSGNRPIIPSISANDLATIRSLLRTTLAL